MTRTLSTLAIALAASLFSAAAPAETIVHYREGQLVDKEDVVRLLAPRTRSIRLLDEAPAAASTSASTSVITSAIAPVVHTPRAAPAEPSGLSLPVRFAFGSAEILPAARAQLDALAGGIMALPAETVVTIEGHTDATGGDAYNLELSRERARSVRDYLVHRHGIERQPPANRRLRRVPADRGQRPARRRKPPRGVPRLLSG